VTRVAIIGAGYFGAFHVDAWAAMEDVEIVALLEADAARGAEIAARHAIPLVTDIDALLSAKPDLFDITTPPPTHLDLIEALAPKIPWLICQKPFCGALGPARRAAASAEMAGARLAVHENFRFQPWYREARRQIDVGVLGEVYQATFRLRPGDGQGPNAYLSRQPYFQQMERFLVHETAIHWIDTFRYLLGEPTGLFARLARLNPAIAGEDAGVVLFDFASGARAVFDGNRLADHAAEDMRRTMGEMWIDGSEASLRLDGAGALWLRRMGEAAETRLDFTTGPGFGGGCVAATCRAILTAFREGRPAETEAAAYLRNMEIEEAVYASAESGRWTPL
jgi:predicted dehydrogenase